MLPLRTETPARTPSPASRWARPTWCTCVRTTPRATAPSRSASQRRSRRSRPRRWLPTSSSSRSASRRSSSCGTLQPRMAAALSSSTSSSGTSTRPSRTSRPRATSTRWPSRRPRRRRPSATTFRSARPRRRSRASHASSPTTRTRGRPRPTRCLPRFPASSSPPARCSLRLSRSPPASASWPSGRCRTPRLVRSAATAARPSPSTSWSGTPRLTSRRRPNRACSPTSTTSRSRSAAVTS
mmetsp:Transcript_12737/g.34578  ORF Transcript_12737/g.34578 Transcript_12737/m.34578 type:complete len:240 (+) Transcript_12737:10720-11439(+)